MQAGQMGQDGGLVGRVRRWPGMDARGETEWEEREDSGQSFAPGGEMRGRDILSGEEACTIEEAGRAHLYQEAGGE